MSLALLLLLFAGSGRTPVEKALDAQDRSGLEKIAAEATEVADHQPTDHKAQYQSAVANSARSAISPTRSAFASFVG